MQSIQEHGHRSDILASPGDGRALSPLTIDGGNYILTLSLSIGQVNYCGLHCLKCGLVVVQFDQLSFNGHSLAGELAPLLCLGWNLVSGGSTAVHNRTIGMVRGVGGPSSRDVVAMVSVGVTMLHPR
jgi:hypothetical protein